MGWWVSMGKLNPGKHQFQGWHGPALTGSLTPCMAMLRLHPGVSELQIKEPFSTARGGLPVWLNSAKMRAEESENFTPGWVCSTAQMKEGNISGGGIKLLTRNWVYLSCQSTLLGSTQPPAFTCLCLFLSLPLANSWEWKPQTETIFKQRQGKENRFFKSKTPTAFTNLDWARKIWNTFQKQYYQTGLNGISGHPFTAILPPM